MWPALLVSSGVCITPWPLSSIFVLLSPRRRLFKTLVTSVTSQEPLSAGTDPGLCTPDLGWNSFLEAYDLSPAACLTQPGGPARCSVFRHPCITASGACLTFG